MLEDGMVGTVALQAPEGILEGSRSEISDFEAIYREYGGRLYGTALRMMRRSEEAEDAVQDAFLSYHSSGQRLPRDQAGPWLHRVVVNRCLDSLRRGKRWKSAEFTEETVVLELSNEGLGLDLENAVSRLPEKARLVFVLHDVEGFKHRELGEMLDLSEGTTKSQLFRARRMLRDFMGRRAS
jgi:RNA polymerase sigma-70 factor (ECF subfamily)